MLRLAILSSHPIQYNAPLFSLLSQREELDVKVFYSWAGSHNYIDREFGEKIIWDIPLLEGYEYSFVKNVSKDPGTHHFRGLDNPAMIGSIECWEADAILVYGWAFKTHLNVLRYFHGRVPIFFRGDSTLLTAGNSARKLLRKIWLSWVYRHVDFAFYPGRRSKEYFSEFGIPSGRLQHVPHSIDNDRFSKNSILLEAESILERKRMGIPSDSLVLLFAGKLVPGKQPSLLLEAVIELVQTQSLDIHLIFVGAGQLKEQLVTLSNERSYIHFLGFRNQSEMPLVYRLGDLYVLPSLVETWGLGVNEAMACSRPVLVSDQVGCSEDLVKSTNSGKVFSAKNKLELMNCICEYYNNRVDLNYMKSEARTLINHWSMEKSARLIADYILLKSLKRFNV